MGRLGELAVLGSFPASQLLLTPNRGWQFPGVNLLNHNSLRASFVPGRAANNRTTTQCFVSSI